MAEPLTQQEQDLVTHVEVYGMPIGRAGELLGIENPHGLLDKPAVMAARDHAKRQLRQRTKITKEDVVEGIQDAIVQAKLLGDPMAQIRGWTEIGKLHDFYSPKRLTIQMTGTITEVRKELAGMPDDQLLDMIGDDGADAIDADFYRVDNGTPPD